MTFWKSDASLFFTEVIIAVVNILYKGEDWKTTVKFMYFWPSFIFPDSIVVQGVRDSRPNIALNQDHNEKLHYQLPGDVPQAANHKDFHRLENQLRNRWVRGNQMLRPSAG